MTTYGQYVVPQPDVLVNLGVGQPSNSELPLYYVKKACSKISEIEDNSLLQYGNIQGYYGFRKCLANFLEKKYLLDVYPDNLFITNGVTGALSLICSLFRKKVKKIYVEDPTYFLAINIFKDFGFEIEPIPMEEDGMNLGILENKLKNDNSDLKLLYTIPTFHNPTSITMSHKKRQNLVYLSCRYNIIILADEVYQLLSFDDEHIPPHPLYYYGGNVFSLSSFSKILAPSLRLGWCQANRELLKILCDSGQMDSGGGVNPFISRIVHNIIEDGTLENYINSVRNRLKERCTILSNSLQNMNFKKPNGGYFIWVNLGPKFNSKLFLEYCIKNKVKFHTGDKFSSNESNESNIKNNENMINYIRLSFSFYTNNGLRIGGERLVESYNKYKILQNNINIGVHGYTGRLGTLICDNIKSESDLNLYNCIGRNITYKPCSFNDVIIDVSPGSPTKIPNFTFSGCSYLKSVVIKTGITEIAHSVFSLCEELESVEIPESVTKIGSTTFSSCRKLTTVNIPHGISSIEYATFSLCEALQQITIPSSVRRIGRNAFAHCKMLQEIVVPENVETIEAYAFRQCRDLKSITLSENLTKIGKQAFDYCLKVKNIIIPDSVTEIGDKAFYETGRLPWGQPFNITMPRSLAQNPDGSLNNGFLAGLGLEPRRSRQIFVNGIEFVNQSTTTSALSTTTANGTTAAGTTANGNTTSMTQRPIGEDDDMFLFNGNKIKNVKDFLDRDVKKQVRNDRDIKSELLKLKFA